VYGKPGKSLPKLKEGNNMRDLTEKDVQFSITPEEEDMSVREGGFEKEDGSPDTELIGKIEEALESNLWAWCSVRVRAHWQGFYGDAHLGGCSYESEKGFSMGGYLPQMKAEALEDLNTKVKIIAKAIAELGFV
jgi:hypothetical protein